jgi:hypothetical protein
LHGTSYFIPLAEILLIFAVFAIQGAWPVPDVNEAYYLGKAIHYWKPDWVQGDFFMESSDTHLVFYYTFGWLSLWLSPTALAWTGRIITWFLLAWSWRRLSVAIVPRRWCSVLTAALFVCLMERCQMAGEWVIGGVEAKGFAYVFVFLGLESLIQNRWNRGLLLFGVAAAFHVLVGGWAAVAAGIAWLLLSARSTCATACSQAVPSKDAEISKTPPLRSLWPGILGGFLLSLPGVIPSLTIDWGVDPSIIRQAHFIYVFERLPHHLLLTGIRPEFILRLGLLGAFWLLLGHWSRCDNLINVRRLRAFVTGAVAITMIGVAIHVLIFIDRTLAADLLRYYWFRLTDVALPLGVALESMALITDVQWKTVRMRRSCLALAILVAAFHLGDRAIDRIAPQKPRSHQMADFEAWREACHWVAQSGKIPTDAQFLTPRLGQTFKWYAGRNDVVDWKDVPQNAKAIVEWKNRIQDIYATGLPLPDRWYQPLAVRGEKTLKQLGTKYQADYLITERTDPLLNLEILYQNRAYVIYRLY